MMNVMAAMLVLGTIALDQRHQGTTVRASSGSTIVVKLEAQLGTGFGWKIAAIGKNLIQVGESTIEDHGGGAGASELQVFRFRVNGKGRGVLRLIYVRPWEKDAKPAKTYSVTIVSK
ncbi:MAG TPA: protease inhibitor I42 family protein [Thermoanaerobaculia bacterium]|nr:protease inhibitor I42 family protein [Thermoanaerobaculia bacterium]